MIFCVGCGGTPHALHHAVTRQVIRRHAPKGQLSRLVADRRNLVPVCAKCHANHHGRLRPLTLACLPDSVFAFATELMGAGAAYEWLRRTYVGVDGRLDALIESEAA